jgi:hypothetical protein
MSDTFLKFFFAIVIVLALMGLLAWALRRFAASRVGTSSGRGRVPRLAVIDATKVDNRRLLVLVRRDNVEHLLMIGGPTDFVVEANIARAAAQGREAPRQPVPDQAWIEPETHAEPMPEPPPRMSRAPLGAEERRPPTMPVPPMPTPPAMPMPPPMPERRPEPMTGFAPESMTRPPQQPRVEPPPRRAEKPAAPPMPAPPVRPPQPPRAEAPRAEAPPIASPAAEAMSQADKNLAEMAQRLEAALRAPGAAPRAEPPPIVPSKVDRVGAPPVAPDAAPARPATAAPEVTVEPQAAAPADNAKPATGFESLEAEMASLLGRPKTPT